ncbi:hypothetical protein SISNIDRAFT_459983 [Sistotremastrum niveocremeum HHB9708]|uniref:Uncharacterized protein n=1 Tax=Sistotremastrum niveocremeum HHB9708 TaxID=1314777 RepID=A0A164P2E5_9AGAM|nr:hypothetical protein SISNIDRAFT_459983 [Sistotremastrum niveocremeum HHB9708]
MLWRPGGFDISFGRETPLLEGPSTWITSMATLNGSQEYDRDELSDCPPSLSRTSAILHTHTATSTPSRRRLRPTAPRDVLLGCLICAAAPCFLSRIGLVLSSHSLDPLSVCLGEHGITDGVYFRMGLVKRCLPSVIRLSNARGFVLWKRLAAISAILECTSRLMSFFERSCMKLDSDYSRTVVF